MTYLAPMRLLLLFVFASSLLFPSESEDRPLGGIATSLSIPAAITSVSLSANTFPGGSPDGTPIGQINVLMTPPGQVFSGSLVLSGADAAKFRISTTTQKVVYLLPGTTSWTVPADWSNTNKIEVIGAGGGASNAGSDDSAGGGGGAYAKIVNRTGLSGTIPVQVGAGGGPTVSGGDTWFNGASLAASSVGAKGGNAASTITGGAGGEQAGNTGSVGTTIHKGGNGGNSNNFNNSGAGGGGAAGSTGDGAAGGVGGQTNPIGAGGGGADGGSIGQNDNVGGAGGAGANGGGMGGSTGTPPMAGGAGTEYDAMHGSGGGGGGAGYVSGFGYGGGAGGQYGGGGGASAFNPGGAPGGIGGDGLIAITYATSTSSPTLVLNGSQPGGTYNVTITASQSGLADFPSNQVITGSAVLQAIDSVSVSGTTFTAGAPDGTAIGPISVTMCPLAPAFAGTLSLTGADAAKFRLSSTLLPSTLLLNGSQAAGTYHVNIVATQAAISNSPATQAVTITGSGATQAISLVALSSNTFTGGAADGTFVGSVNVTMNPSTPPFSGTFSLTGTDAARFKLSSTTLPSNLLLNGSQAAGSYSLNIVATQAGATGSPFSAAQTITGSSTTQSISAVSLSNRSFAGGSPDGSLVGAVSVVMAPASPAFSGTLSLTGTDAARFRLSSTTAPSNLLLNGSQASGSYQINVVATQAGATGSPFSAANTITGVTVTGLLTTFTMQNDSGGTLPAGTPISFGQGFRYGDIIPSTHPLIRDATTHAPLAGQQWDEISTWRENGGNGSWRHAVWGAWLPNSLAAGATYQVEFVVASGSYSETSHQALSALCSGAAAHDLKILLTDVRNVDNTTRDSGTATFRVCDNIANVGRDAPRHVRAGNIYDEYVVSGMFVYTGAGHKDPLLYAQCNIDIFTKASDGVSPGDVRWVCHMHNSWMNVGAGSAGNAGAPGPVGFAGDPQMVSYRFQVSDGASLVLDYSNFDATISSASNPVVPVSGICDNFYGPYCIQIPGSTGTNQWYYGLATRASCSSCPGGLVNDRLFYPWPASNSGTNGADTRYVTLSTSPNADANQYVLTGTQGSGTTTFTTEIPHYHGTAWQTLDSSGQSNWSPFGTTTRVTRKVYPAFTQAEKIYWEQSGVIIPVNLSQPVAAGQPSPAYGQGKYYEPYAKGVVIGGVGTGPRPDLSIYNEYAVYAWLDMTEARVDLARLFSYGSPIHGWTSVFLNEATGRIPVFNNGPPTGPGGNGNGGSYPELGAPLNQVTVGYAECDGFLCPQTDNGGMYGSGTYISHTPSFTANTYALFGDRHFLDFIHWKHDSNYMWQRTGPGSELGQGYYRDNFAVFPGDGQTYHYWGLMIDCCQTRGSARMFYSAAQGAAFGGDNNVERSYYNDFLVENRNYYPLWLKHHDGPGNSNFSNSLIGPDAPGGGDVQDIFQLAYVMDAAWLMVTLLHEPLGMTWETKTHRIYEGVLGKQLAGAPNSYTFITYASEPSIHNGNDGGLTPFQGNYGSVLNGTDASDYGDNSSYTYLLSGGQVALSLPVQLGDTIKPITGSFPGIGSTRIDQLDGLRWYNIIGPIDPSNGTFYLQCNASDHAAFPAQCPVAGQAFTNFTVGGGPLPSEQRSWTTRYTKDPGACQGYIDNNYVQYAGQTMSALHLLGFDVHNAEADFAFRCGQQLYNEDLPSWYWDTTVVIPGLPSPVPGLP